MLLSKSPRTWIFLSWPAALPCSRCKTEGTLILYVFFLLVCKLGGGGHPWLSHYTCKQWLYTCNLWISRIAQQFYVTQTSITHCHTKSSCCKENAAGPDWWQHCHSSLCPRDSVSFHSDSEACKLTQTHTQGCGTESTDVQSRNPRERCYQMVTCPCWG